MNDTKHTPGPWTHRHFGGLNEVVSMSPESQHKSIATVPPNDVDVSAAYANARLIASAPALVDALQTFLAHYKAKSHLQSSLNFAGAADVAAQALRDAGAQS